MTPQRRDVLCRMSPPQPTAAHGTDGERDLRRSDHGSGDGHRGRRRRCHRVAGGTATAGVLGVRGSSYRTIIFGFVVAVVVIALLYCCCDDAAARR